MTFSELRAEAERLIPQAQRMLQRDGSHGPILFAYGSTPPPAIVGFSGRLRAPLGTVLKAALQQLEATAFICIHEAWVLTGPAAQENLPPSQHPQRQEALVVSAVHPEGRIVWAIPFTRTGPQIAFGQPEIMEGAGVQGGIPDALQWRGQSSEEGGCL